MKKNILVITIFISTMSFGQQIDKYSMFSNRKKSIDLNTGITLKYIEEGNKTGIPVILLHGYTDTSRSFQLMIDELMRISKNFRIIAPDLRGHGESSMPDAALCAGAPEKCFTPAQFAADIINLMDKLRIPKVNLVGHSMGSVIAQELALNFPHRISNMVLIGTFVDGTKSASVQNFLIHDLVEGAWKTQLECNPDFNWPNEAYLLTPNSLGEEAKSFLWENWVVEVSAEERLREAIHVETCYTHLGTWIGAIKALGEVDNRSKLSKLKIPTLILWASQDIAFPEADQELVRAAFATAQPGTKVIYKVYGKRPFIADGIPLMEVGHNLQWAAPKEVALDVVSFINSGYPMKNKPYTNPQDLKEILVDAEEGEISLLNR